MKRQGEIKDINKGNFIYVEKDKHYAYVLEAGIWSKKENAWGALILDKGSTVPSQTKTKETGIYNKEDILIGWAIYPNFDKSARWWQGLLTILIDEKEDSTAGVLRKKFEKYAITNLDEIKLELKDYEYIQGVRNEAGNWELPPDALPTKRPKYCFKRAEAIKLFNGEVKYLF